MKLIIFYCCRKKAISLSAAVCQEQKNTKFAIDGVTLATNLKLDCKLCFSRFIARKNEIKILVDRSESHQSKYT